MVRVSIIVPVYNTGKYLKKCINSILNQTLKDIELIIINDGSPDNADEIISTYNDERIVYIKKENSGIGSTRNLGIEKASGEYLMFIDSDDYIEKNCAQEMYEQAKKRNLDIAMSDYFEDRCCEIREIKFPPFSDSSLEDNPSILSKINLGPCNKIYKRSLFDNKNNRFEEHLKYEDAPFVIKMFLSSKKIGKIDECLSHYVIHEKSETTVRDKRIFDIIKITEIIISDMSKYSYLHDYMVYIVVMILTDYTIQQRYISSRVDRNRFIDEAFSLLDKTDKNWRKCPYLDKFPRFKRMIKTSKLLSKMYCTMYYKMEKRD